MAFLARSPWTYETMLWRTEQGKHLTHVFEVSHWDWPESQAANAQMLDFFDRACSLS